MLSALKVTKIGIQQICIRLIVSNHEYQLPNITMQSITDLAAFEDGRQATANGVVKPFIEESLNIIHSLRLGRGWRNTLAKLYLKKTRFHGGKKTIN